MAIRYDDDGEIAQMITKRDGKNYGYSVSRDDEGRIQMVQSSWGEERYSYDPSGGLASLTIEKPGRQVTEQAVLEFESGRLRHVKQFDGGEITISYHDNGLLADLPDRINCANGLQLDYSYDASGNIGGVTLGNDRRIALEYDEKGRLTGYAYLPVKD